MQNVILHHGCTFRWLWLMNLLYIIVSLYHNEQSFFTIFYCNLQKIHHYKQKCKSLRYKHCDTHTSTSLLRRMSTTTSWLFPLHPHHVPQSTFSVRLLLAGLDLGEDWLICSIKLTRPCVDPTHQGWLYVWINRPKILKL